MDVQLVARPLLLHVLGTPFTHTHLHSPHACSSSPTWGDRSSSTGANPKAQASQGAAPTPTVTPFPPRATMGICYSSSYCSGPQTGPAANVLDSDACATYCGPNGLNTVRSDLPWLGLGCGACYIVTGATRACCGDAVADPDTSSPLIIITQPYFVYDYASGGNNCFCYATCTPVYDPLSTLGIYSVAGDVGDVSFYLPPLSFMTICLGRACSLCEVRFMPTNLTCPSPPLPNSVRTSQTSRSAPASPPASGPRMPCPHPFRPPPSRSVSTRAHKIPSDSAAATRSSM
jgi:hypothetical protein